VFVFRISLALALVLALDPFYIQEIEKYVVRRRLEGLNWSIESSVSAESGSQGRDQEGGQRDVLEQVGALADQEVHLVTLLRGALVQGDAPQARGTWQVSVMKQQSER